MGALVTEDVQDRVGWRTLRSNASAVLAARLLVPVCNVLLVVTIARIQGAALLGQYTLLVTLFLRSEEHTSELQSHVNLVCRLLLEKKKKKTKSVRSYYL